MLDGCVGAIREKYPADSLIRCIRMNDPFPVNKDELGEVRKVDDAGQILMHWSSGRSVALIEDEDEFELLDVNSTGYLTFNEDGSVSLLQPNEYEDSYHCLRAGVKGLIECVSYDEELYKKRIDMWVNEEGKLLAMDPNMIVVDKNGETMELLVGPVVFTKTNDVGESLPLNYMEILYLLNRFKESSAILYRNRPYPVRKLVCGRNE